MGSTVQQLKILLLDDDVRITLELSEYLVRKKFIVHSSNTSSRAFEILKKQPVDIMILDIKLDEKDKMDGMDVLKEVKRSYPAVEVIMITGFGDMEMVIQAMRLGAIDFLNKPFQNFDIQIAIERTQKYVLLQNHLQRLENKNSLITRELETQIEKDFIGESEAIKSNLNVALKLAKDRDVNVLVTGESGTGKEIIARIIHYASDRKAYPFCPVNSSAIPEPLLESEFFGHRKGAFTGATEDKKGFFELADKGTLFLDEISEMPFQLQAKLLRAIEEKRIKQVGGNKEIEVDIRIISATNKDLDSLIKEKKFRMDLLHRINTVCINIPPLRERTEDIESLLFHFIRFFARRKNIPVPKINPGLVKKLKLYSFPGNVRELRNLIERAMILSNKDELDLSDFPITFDVVRNDTPLIKDLNILENEKSLIVEALNRTNFNQNKTAEYLGIGRGSLISKMKKHNIVVQKDVDK